MLKMIRRTTNNVAADILPEAAEKMTGTKESLLSGKRVRISSWKKQHYKLGAELRSELLNSG